MQQTELRPHNANNGKWRYQYWFITNCAYSYLCTAVWAESEAADFSVFACNIN